MAKIVRYEYATMTDEREQQEIERRRDEAIRRALNTPPKPNSEYIGKSERAKQRQRDKFKKAAPEGPAKGEV